MHTTWLMIFVMATQTDFCDIWGWVFMFIHVRVMILNDAGLLWLCEGVCTAICPIPLNTNLRCGVGQMNSPTNMGPITYLDSIVEPSVNYGIDKYTHDEYS